MNRDKLLQWMDKEKLDAFLIISAANRRYFSGFTGSNGYLIITKNESILITDQRYTEQAALQAPGFTIVTHGIDAFGTCAEVLEKVNPNRIGYETKRITDFHFRKWQGLQSNIAWIPTEDVGMKLRAVKEPNEIEWIKKSIAIAEKAFLETMKWISIGVTEREIMVELEYQMKKLGSDGVAFDTIVASGKRSSLPHGYPTDKKIELGDPIVIDFGAVYQGYMSDITRTIWVGEPDQEHQMLFDQVLEAQEAAVLAIKPGMTGMEIDQVHRDVFLRHEIEAYSLRGLGHGVGLEIHEEPRVVMKNTDVIEENMIFTVEPGIYIPDFGGIRTEDMVLVTKEGARVLTSLPKRILISK